MEKIRGLALLSDILPTAFHGLMEAGAKPGSTVYIAGAGPVGRCGAAAAPDAYATFDSGASEKFIIDPHGIIPA